MGSGGPVSLSSGLLTVKEAGAAEFRDLDRLPMRPLERFSTRSGTA